MDRGSWGLGSTGPAWPTDPRGEKEPAALLCRLADDPAQAGVIQSLLAAYGVPCLSYYDQQSARVITGTAANGVGLYVPASRLAEAQELLSARPSED